MAKQAEIN